MQISDVTMLHFFNDIRFRATFPNSIKYTIFQPHYYDMSTTIGMLQFFNNRHSTVLQNHWYKSSPKTSLPVFQSHQCYSCTTTSTHQFSQSMDLSLLLGFCKYMSTWIQNKLKYTQMQESDSVSITTNVIRVWINSNNTDAKMFFPIIQCNLVLQCQKGMYLWNPDTKMITYPLKFKLNPKSFRRWTSLSMDHWSCSPPLLPRKTTTWEASKKVSPAHLHLCAFGNVQDELNIGVVVVVGPPWHRNVLVRHSDVF